MNTPDLDLPAEAEEKRIPVTVLTGFLGSGKTTLMNRILTENHGKRIAVIENEFGEIGIDDALVINAEEEIFEMNNGCICCTVRGDLIRILGNLMRRKNQFDYILIETTGLADPAPVAQTFFVDDEIRSQLKLDGIVTLVDSKHVWQHIDSSMECKEQIAFADVILLNKIDLVEPDILTRLEERIRSMNAMATIYRTENTQIEMDRILSVGGFDLERALSVRPTFLETEYPFEWAGLYKLDQARYTFSLKEGPDPSMNLIVCPIEIPLGQDLRSGIESIQEDAAHWFSETAKMVAPQEILQSNSQLVQLSLNGLGEKQFYLDIPVAGNYILFTQHLPEEFEMRVLKDSNEIQPEAHKMFQAAHEHDNTVSSVGIECEGDLDSKKFREWLGFLLRERGTDIFRMKGIVSIHGENSRFVFQGVHMLFDGQPDRPWGNEPRGNQLIFIGRHLNREELVKGFQSCLVPNTAPSLILK